MRVGENPSKGQAVDNTKFVHQVLMPVYIPHHQDYYEHSFEVLKLSIESLCRTANEKTGITVINNGSSNTVRDWLTEQHVAGRIHEVIHTGPIGKYSAVIKGLVGSSAELVTISDADVLFLPGWQKETYSIFKTLPKAGVVGLVPQFRMYGYFNGKMILDTIFSGRLKFLPVRNKPALEHFYESIGWKKEYNPDYLSQILGFEQDKIKVLAGSGHFVATYRRAIFRDMPTQATLRLGGGSMQQLDAIPREKGYWRVTTYDNFAYHMGNVPDDWMPDLVHQMVADKVEPPSAFTANRSASRLYYYIDWTVTRILKNKKVYRAFLRHCKLPAPMRQKF